MLERIEFRAMGCRMLAAVATSSARGIEALRETPRWFEGWEACLSRFRAESELNRLNSSPGRYVPVSETLWEVFQCAIEAEVQSAGLVSPTVLGALEAAGYERSFELIPSGPEGEGAAFGPAASLGTVAWSAESRSICLPAGVRLDFGGVAKGWAAHQAMQRLQAYGPALVDAGGDIAISGLLPGGEYWLVGVENPLQPGSNLAILKLGHSGVATSGRDYRRWKRGQGWQHHIIDPRSGQPADTDVLCATVVASSLLQAEMAAKTVLILGSQAGLKWLEGHPSWTGLLVLEGGEVIYAPGIERYLEK